MVKIYSTKEELLKVAKEVGLFNTSEGDKDVMTDGYFSVYRNIVYNFNLNLTDTNGKICSANLCSKALNVYLLLKAKRHESNNGTNKNFEPELEYSCYLTIENIAKITRIRKQTVSEILDVLAYNGYIIRKAMISERNGKPKYFFYVLNYPNKLLVEQLGDTKLSYNKGVDEK